MGPWFKYVTKKTGKAPGSNPMLMVFKTNGLTTVSPTLFFLVGGGGGDGWAFTVY